MRFRSSLTASLLPVRVFPASFAPFALALSILATLFPAFSPVLGAADPSGGPSGLIGPSENIAPPGEIASDGEIALAGEIAPLKRTVLAGKAAGDFRPGFTRSDRIVVKFREGSGVRLRGGVLTSLDPAVDLRDLAAWFASHPGVTVLRHFQRNEADIDEARRTGSERSGVELADLNLYYEFLLPRDLRGASDLLTSIRSLPIVETAFAEPLPQPAAMDPGPPTPDYTGQQGYLGASPSGVNAQAVWSFPGGRGAGVRILDIEGAWLWNHEDLKAPFFTGGTPIDDSGWRNHGTAVMGEMVGGNNGFGVTGIASDLQVGGVSIGDMGVATAIDLASANLDPGDLFLIGLHAPGPNFNGSGQFGYLPMEFWQDNFDAIQTAVANGRICIEAGGNGEQNLDDAVYHNAFNRAVRNSGAIMVGAGTPNGLDAEWFTNYGTRLDLQGWGSSVTTCGYGDLQGGAETQWYTSWFSGTSSASPIVAGSVASLQGMSESTWGISLNAPLALQILYQSGSPWSGTKRIGRRPNLSAARTVLLQGVGLISGVVRDAGTGNPIAGADVRIVDMDCLLRSDENGTYSAPVIVGSHTLRGSDFFHSPAEVTASVAAGGHTVQDILITAYPTGVIGGTVLTAAGVPVPSARVRIINTPIAEATSDGSGSFQIPGVPAALGYRAVTGLVPGRGASFRLVNASAGQTTWITSILPDAQTFEASNGSYAGTSPWEWGVPSVVGPPSAFSGTKLWATNLTGNYPDNSVADLTTPTMDFSGAGSLTLSFTHWYDLESGFDGGCVQVRSGSTWVTVSPIGGYPMDNLAGIGFDSGFSGLSGGWQPAVFDLSAYIGSSVQVRFHFGSDGGVNGAGWYIDDVAFDSGAASAEVAAGTAPVRAPALRISPSPFREAADLRLDLARSAHVSLRVYAADGRCLRVLADASIPAGTVRFRWDGTDSRGRAVPIGVYFCEVTIDGQKTEARPLIRIR